ncbi:MAG: ATPase [Pseudomonadota bacterium]
MKMRRFSALGCVAALAAASWSTAARSEVLHADVSGFVVRHQVAVMAPRETAWRMLVGHVAEWWHSDHTYSGNAANLYIEERALGCFCEQLGEQDAVVHLTVTAIRTGSLLRLTGGLGPLGLMGVDGNMVFSFGESEGKTIVVLEYRVGGYDPDGLEAIAPAVDGMLGEQLERYVRFVESGSPTAEDSADDALAPIPDGL